MAQSIAELSLSFGLVSIPVRLYSATETKEQISFNLLHRKCGSRVKQQYTCVKEGVIVERSDMMKGYEFAKDQYVSFTPDELKLLEEPVTQTVDIVAFIPEGSIDPIYFDKAYYLAPNKRGDRPYKLLLEGMKKTGRCALARWAWRGKSYTVQVRPGIEGGLVLQQLLYANEVRSIGALNIQETEIKPTELDLAVMLIEQTSEEGYDPARFKDDAKERILAMIDQKISGKEIVTSPEPEKGSDSTNVIDLVEVLRASLAPNRSAPPAKKTRSKKGATMHSA